MNTAAPYRAAREHLLARAERDAKPTLVRIDHNRIVQTVWPAGPFPPISTELPAAAMTPAQALAFLLVPGALNYRFWRLAGGELQRYYAHGRRGARALWTATIAAWGPDPTPQRFQLAFRESGIAGIYGAIPDPGSRETLLREVLLGHDPVAAELAHWVADTGEVTVAMAQWLAGLFPVAFGGPLLKKAQLLLAMFAGWLAQRGTPVRNDGLTAFADYQVPRVLRALGILHYAPELAAKVDGHVPLPSGGDEERALRGATLLACERIAAHLHSTAANVDNVLWLSQHRAGETLFHLTETTAY